MYEKNIVERHLQYAHKANENSMHALGGFLRILKNYGMEGKKILLNSGAPEKSREIIIVIIKKQYGNVSTKFKNEKL